MGNRERSTLIHVPRTLIRDCVEILAKLVQWKRRPLRSVIRLIYCLNTLWDRYPLVLYDRGFPRPAQCVRELRGVAGLCRRAARTGNSGPLLGRLSALRRDKAASYNLLIYEVARELRPGRPEAMLHDAATDQRLLEIAVSEANYLAEICEARASILRPLVSMGRGGDRRQEDLADRLVVESLGHYFEWLTKGRPTVPYRGFGGDGPKDWYYGPFFLLCRTVFAALGRTVSSRQVFDLLSSIDIPRWKIPEKLRRAPWNPNLRKKKLRH